MEPPPPPPPPHGHGSSQPGGRSGGLPDGKYDIFVIPPHSSGSGFLYLPSLHTQRNSFLAGCFCTAASFFIYTTAVPVVKDWLLTTINGGGGGVFMLICGIAVVAWAFGKTQGEWAQPADNQVLIRALAGIKDPMHLTTPTLGPRLSLIRVLHPNLHHHHPLHPTATLHPSHHGGGHPLRRIPKQTLQGPSLAGKRLEKRRGRKKRSARGPKS